MKRSEIYLKAAILCKNAHDRRSIYNYGCERIKEVSRSIVNEKSFPEFFLMKPTTREVNDFDQQIGGWFGRSYRCGDYLPQNVEDRINALLFAHEIAKLNGQ